MNPVFEILPEAIDAQQTNLIFEISENSVAYFFQNDDDKIIVGLKVFLFGENNLPDDPENLLKNIFDDSSLINKNFNKVLVSYAFPESVLVPVQFYKFEQHAYMLNLIYGDLYEGFISTDLIAEKNIYNIYRVRSAVHNSITSHYPVAAASHQYSIIAKQLPEEENLLKVIFYQNKIVAGLVKDRKLQIIQTYYYKAPEDIAYYMLNMCRQFEITDVAVELCGMIEKDSVLFKEIRKYFLNIKFAQLNDECKCVDDLKKFPSHFFSHLFSIASCV